MSKQRGASRRHLPRLGWILLGIAVIFVGESHQKGVMTTLLKHKTTAVQHLSALLPKKVTMLNTSPIGLSFVDMLTTMKKSKCYRDYRAPLEVMFLIDRTSKRVLKTAPRIVEIVGQLAEEYPGSRFGVSYYADFQCTDWYPEEMCHEMVDKKMAHEEPEGCYTRGVNLTASLNKVKSAVWFIDHLGGNTTASGVAGLLMTAVDRKVGWTKPQGVETDRNKIIFLITDGGTTCCQKSFGTKQPPRGGGRDSCSTMENPTPDFVGRKLRKHEISLFLVLGKGDAGAGSWTKVMEQMQVQHGKANMLEESNDEILQKFNNFVVQLAYNNGPVFCTPDDGKEGAEEREMRDSILLDVVFLVDRSSQSALVAGGKLVEIMTEIREDFPRSRFGLSFYGDFSCTRSHEREECLKLVAGGGYHMEEDGCYTFYRSLTSAPKDFPRVTANMDTLAVAEASSGIAGILMAAGDKKMAWREKSRPNGFKIIFLITDQPTHCCELKFGWKKIPKGDGKDKCSLMNNPSPEAVGKVLQQNGISLFLTVVRGEEGETAGDSWSEMSKRMRVTASLEEVDEVDTSALYRKFKKFMVKQVARRLSECVL